VPSHSSSLGSAWVAAGWYLVATLVLTWPLLPGLLHDLPADLGDPVLNCWILHWDVSHFLRFLSGDLGALRGFWQGNFFHPAPLVLAYSEHLVPQAIAILPVYAATGNVVLCYNLLFLSTFVLSGLGVYLLTRSLTGNPAASLVAGLLFAFCPYRVAQMTHVQVLSTQWMAFTLYGLHRFFERSSSAADRSPSPYWPLAGATAALVLQNLSCGYFLLFFGPVAAAYAVWEVLRRGLIGDWRLLARLALAGVIVAAATWPFLQPYLELRTFGYSARTLQEVREFSANVLSYLTAPATIRGWGRLFRAYFIPEGELFPGLIALALALSGFAGSAWSAWRTTSAGSLPWWRRALVVVAGAWAVGQALAVLYVLVGGGRVVAIGPLELRLKGFGRLVLIALAAVAVWTLVSPRVRKTGRQIVREYGFWVTAAIVAAFLSFGPEIHTGPKEIAAGPYLLLYQHVPGFDGLRVPSRYGLVVALTVAVLAGIGLDRLLRGRKHVGLVAAGVAALFVTECFAAPIPINESGGTASLRAPGPILQGERVPAAYRYLRGLAGREPVVEFPFGDPGYELQYVYYTTEHGHPIVNGYSGIFPPVYNELRNALEQPDLAHRWNVLSRSSARLAIVHEGAYRRRTDGEAVSSWLVANGARLVADFGADKVFRLP
jgi:hypothetical protein